MARSPCKIYGIDECIFHAHFTQLRSAHTPCGYMYQVMNVSFAYILTRSLLRADIAGKLVFQTMDTTWQTYNCWGSTNT